MNKPNVKLWPGWEIDAVGTAVCLALTVAVYLFGVQPALDAHARFVLQQQQVKSKQRTANAARSGLSAAQQQLKLATHQVATSPLRLKPAGQLNNRLAELTSLANDSGMQIEDIQPGGGSHGRRYDTIPMKITGKGTFLTCVQFLHQLRATFPDTGVSSLHLSGNPADPSAACDFDFSLDWYAAPERH